MFVSDEKQEMESASEGEAGVQEPFEVSSAVEEVYLSGKPYTPSKDYSAVGFGVFVFYALWQVLVILMAVLYYSISGLESISISYSILLSLIGELLSVPAYVFIVRGKNSEAPEKVKLRFGQMMSCLAVVYFLGIAGNLIGIVVNSLISNSGGTVSVSNLSTYFDNSFFAMVIYAAVVAPVLEELLFRKLLIDRVVRYNKSIAMLTSGLLFGLIHGNLQQFFYAFLLGCFFAFIYIRTGNIKYTIILHACMNGLSTLLTYLMSRIKIFDDLTSDYAAVVEELSSDGTQLILMMLLLLLILFEYGMAIAGLVFTITHFREFSFGEDHTKTAGIRKCYFNPGMIVCLVFLVGLIILAIFGITI